MKSTSEIINQYSRIHDKLKAQTRLQLLGADATTGGDMLLAHNWGNKACREILDKHDTRLRNLALAYKNALDKAFINEYPDHKFSKVFKALKRAEKVNQ